MIEMADSLVVTAKLFILSFVIFVPCLLLFGLVNCSLKPTATEERPPKESFIVSGLFVGLPMGFTGMAAGFLTGLSRLPAVSALVPAILANFCRISYCLYDGKGSH